MKYRKYLIILSSLTIIILLFGIACYLLLPSPAEKFLVKDNHGRTYASFVKVTGVTSYDYYSKDESNFSNNEADLLNVSYGVGSAADLITAFSKNKQIFQANIINDSDSFSNYAELMKSRYDKTELDRFIGLNQSNNMHGVNNSGDIHGAMDETAEKNRYKVSGRNSIIISQKILNADNHKWENRTIKLTDIKENKNGSWTLFASRPDEKNNKIVKTHLILFPLTVE